MVKLNPKSALNQFDLHFHFLRILKWCASTSLSYLFILTSLVTESRFFRKSAHNWIVFKKKNS